MIQAGAEAAFRKTEQQPPSTNGKVSKKIKLGSYSMAQPQDYRQRTEIETKGFRMGTRKTFLPMSTVKHWNKLLGKIVQSQLLETKMFLRLSWMKP